MMSPYLLSIGAGFVSATLYFSYVSGIPIAVLLLALCPLPIVLVSLGWGSFFGLVSSLSATVFVLIALPDFITLTNVRVSFGFFLFFCLPFLVLSYLYYLNRPAGADSTQMVQGEGNAEAIVEAEHTQAKSSGAPNISNVEWYPAGQLIVWIAGFSAVLASLFMLQFASSYAEYFKQIDTIWQQAFAQFVERLDSEPPSQQAIENFKFNLAVTIPVMLAFSIYFLIYGNFWLGAKILDVSDRLGRPLPDFTEIEFPNSFLMVFTASLFAVIFLSGYPKFIAIAIMTAFATAYFFMGLMVMHAVLRGSQFRTFALVSLYFLLLLLGWLALILIIIGVGEPLFNLRRKASQLPPQ